MADNAIAYVRPFVRLFPLYRYISRTDWPLTLNFCEWVGHDHSSPWIEGQGHGLRSWSWARLMRSVRHRSRAIFLAFSLHRQLYNVSWPVCLYVCLYLATCLHYCTCPDVPPVTWENGIGCTLVVHYRSTLQSVHGFRCYGNIRGWYEMSARTLVLAVHVWLV